MRGVILLVVVVVVGIGAYLNSHQSVRVTSCNTVLQTCTQSTYPVTQQSP